MFRLEVENLMEPMVPGMLETSSSVLSMSPFAHGMELCPTYPYRV